MSRIPVRLRVTLVFAAVMALVLGGTGLFLYLRLRAELNDSIDRALHSRVTELTSLIRVTDSGLGESARDFVKESQGEHFAQVLTASGEIFDPSHQANRPAALDPAQVRAADRGSVLVETSEVPGIEGARARLLAVPIRFEGRRLIVAAAEGLANRDDALGSLKTLLFVGGPVALLLAALAAYGTVGAALRPVEAMRRRAAEISALAPDERLPVPPARDELSRLGETLNAMLSRVQAAVEREHRFVDDASHELRTPLALQRTELELALRYSETPEELRASIASAITEADRLIQLAEGLLMLAGPGRGELDLDVADVAVRPLLDDLRARFESRAVQEGRSVVVAGDGGIRINGDRLRLEQALTNLVENALRHGKGEVRLVSTRRDGVVELHVTDQGPGFPEDFMGSAFERFSKADPGRGQDGAGLGLSIVERIAEAHGGRAEAANHPDGGADVWIELPM